MTAPPAKSATRALQALFDEAGLVPADPDILQPASVFLDLSGEDIRRRLFLVQDPAGAEFCLRPDYTIPVSRMHLAAGTATPAGYSYLGPVFRYRPGGTGEFLQAGVERFGDADAEAADADVVAFSLKAVRAFGLERPEIRLGDPGLFMAFVSALGLPEPWPRRLRAAFGRPGGLLETLQPREGDEDGGRAPLLSSLARDDPAAARAAVEEMMAIAGIAPVGGRGPEEIAERLLEKAQLAAGGGIDRAAREMLVAAARVRGTPAAAHARFSGLAREAGLDLSAELAAFERRTRLMAERGVPVDRIRFAADFGRRLDYYTGFVFEVFDPAEPDLQAVGGGRYDRLLSMLGAPGTIPAVGCAIWIDRLSGKEGR